MSPNERTASLDDHVPAPLPQSDLRSSWSEASTIARLHAELQARALVIHEQQAELSHFRKLFERASAAARIGVWQCELADEALTWTDVVYDLFDLPRGTPLTRSEILRLYPDHSRRTLERVRSDAIAARSGFQLDVEITTAKGASRWIRITATVECDGGRPARIFGMKQDITEERAMSERLRHMAEFDAMTGLANRARFQARLACFDRPGDPLRDGGTLMIVDLDGFKQINDTFGHVVGDDCIRSAARKLAAVCDEADLVARIGGDEFAVIWQPRDAAWIERTAATLVAELSDTVALGERSLPLGASVGIAQANGSSASDLFRLADAAMYDAKSSGRNTWRHAAT